MLWRLFPGGKLTVDQMTSGLYHDVSFFCIKLYCIIVNPHADSLSFDEAGITD